MQGRGSGIPHSQPSDQDQGTAAVGDSCAGKLGQGILRAVEAAVHEFAAIQPDREFFAALV